MEMIDKSLQINEEQMQMIGVIGKHGKSMEMIEKSLQINEQSMEILGVIGKSLKFNGTD